MLPDPRTALARPALARPALARPASSGSSSFSGASAFSGSAASGSSAAAGSPVRAVVACVVLVVCVVLSGCTMSSSRQDEVSEKLQLAAEGASSYVSGEVDYIEGFSQGKEIRGSFTFEADSRDDLAREFAIVVRQLVRVAADEELPDEALVTTTGWADTSDGEIYMDAGEAVGVEGGPNSRRVGDLRGYFGF